MERRLPGTPNAAPRFYITGRQPLRPGAILLAFFGAAAVLAFVLYGLGRTGHSHFLYGAGASRSASARSGAASAQDDKDDPNQIDTIVLGDPADAPVPARPGDHVSPVHPTILVRLPRFGDEAGLIPDTPAGRLLYSWLAAFNQADYDALLKAQPADAHASAQPPDTHSSAQARDGQGSGPSTAGAAASQASAQMKLRQQTGGFELLSAKEVKPGVLVFRLRDQTPAAAETLGTLQVLPNSSPAAIATFSLRTLAPEGYTARTGDSAQR